MLLKLMGYQGLSMSQLQPYLRGEKSGKVVGITFDDGYLNNLTNALPVLQKHGFSSTCYAVSGLLGQTNLWDAKIGIAQTPYQIYDGYGTIIGGTADLDAVRALLKGEGLIPLRTRSGAALQGSF